MAISPHLAAIADSVSGNPRRNRGRGRPRRSSEVPLAGSRALDRKSAIPLYYQLAEALKQALEVGAWKAGARFPTEREISEVFGVSRTVIRPALDLLVGDGAIFRLRGKGAFVAPPKREVPVLGLLKTVAEGLDQLTLTVLAAHRRSPDRMVAHFLQLESSEQAEVAQVTGLLHVEGKPVCYLDSYSLVAHMPWLLPMAEGLAERSRPSKLGHLELTRADSWLEGTYLGQFSATNLDATAGDPALLARLVQFGHPQGSTQEIPLEFARLISASDSTQFVFEVD